MQKVKVTQDMIPHITAAANAARRLMFDGLPAWLDEMRDTDVPFPLAMVGYIQGISLTLGYILAVSGRNEEPTEDQLTLEVNAITSMLREALQQRVIDDHRQKIGDLARASAAPTH